jgi:hypothetical protein
MSHYGESISKEDLQNLKEFISSYITLNDKESQIDTSFILKFVSSNPSNFKVLISHLETFLTSNNDILRKNSVKLFAIILERLPNLDLGNSEEYKNLLKFAYSKMKDVVCAPSSVKIIYCIFY